MRVDKKVQVILKFGPGQADTLVIDAARAEIRWDKNSFIIRGLLQDNIIKIENEDAHP